MPSSVREDLLELGLVLRNDFGVLVEDDETRRPVVSARLILSMHIHAFAHATPVV